MRILGTQTLSHSGAQHDLGAIYDRGVGVAEDDRAALNWYRKAAMQGVQSAQYLMGMMYLDCEGVRKTLQKR